MSDTYGSGLDPSAGAPAIDNSGTLPAQGSMPTPQPQSENPIQQFGSSLAKMLPGAHYTPPDPSSSALDQSASLLQQRIQRAGQIATNPLAQLFAPEQVQAARDFVPKATEQLRTIAQQKAQVQAGRAQAQSMGLTPDEAPDQATQDDRIQVAQAKALKGDMRAFQGLQAVSPQHAAAIAPQVYNTIAGHLNNAQLAFDSLAGMTNEGQYRAKVNQLRQDGTLADLESLGLKLPPTFDAFNNSKAAEGLALRNARIAVNTTGQQLEDRNTYQPMPKDEAATYAGRWTTAYGDHVTNGSPSRNAASNTRGNVINGLAIPEALGKGGVLGNAEQRKQIGSEFAAAVPKEDIEKYRQFNRTYQLATTDAKGNVLPEGKINTNPNVQQGISEGLASMLRGGSGGANVGLLKIELGKRGWAQSAIDGLVTNYAGVMNTLFANADKPYLSEETQKQIRDVMDVLKTYTDSNITDRAGNIARRAGALGFGVDALGLGKDESSGAIGGAIEEGRQAQIARMRPNFQAIGGGDGVLQLGAQRPGASAIGTPPGAQPYNQLPGAEPLLTPVQQAGQNADASSGGTQPRPVPPTGSQPSGSTGQLPAGPSNTAIAKVSTETGIDPGLMHRVAQIESGGRSGPEADTGSYKGLYQLSQAEFNKYGGGNIYNPEDNARAFANKTKAEAAQFQATNGRAPTPAEQYLMHQQGVAGLAAHEANPDAPAWRNMLSTGEGQQKGEKWAKAAIWGNMPDGVKAKFPGGVDSVTSRQFMDVWQAKVGGAVAPTAAAAPTDVGPDVSTYLTPGQREAAARRGVETDPAKVAWNRLTPEQQAQERAANTQQLAGMAPAALGTIGGVAAGVPGGLVGGGAGQMLKDYIQGNPQSGAKIAEEAALSGVLGVASKARPILAAATRAVGSGAIEAGATAAEGGSGPDIVDAGARGAATAAGGEAFGRALGMATHKVFNLFTPGAQTAVRAAAKDLHEANQALATTQPKLPTGDANPAYDAAQAAKDKAEATIKEMLPNAKPDEVAYAHKVTSEGVPLQEAQVSKPGALEQQRVGAGYQQLESEVGAKGVGAVKAAPKLTDGPMAAVANKQVSADHAELAQRAEMAITAPAANWQEKWRQLQDARSNLLQAERDALSSTATGKTQTANDMRTLADTVRAQQAKAADYVFGPKQGPQVMQRLNALDVRYRRLMDATNGGDLAQAAGLKGEAGREADQKFRAFAAGDPTAIAAWNAMRRGGTNYEKGVYNVVAAEGVPVLGKLYSGLRLLGSFNRWMQERAAGSPAKFSDILAGLPDSGAQAARNVAGTVVQRGAVQGVGAQQGATQ